MNFRSSADMPFTRHISIVAIVTEDLTESDTLVIKVSLVRRVTQVGDHVAHSSLVLVQPCQKGGPRRAAP